MAQVEIAEASADLAAFVERARAGGEIVSDAVLLTSDAKLAACGQHVAIAL